MSQSQSAQEQQITERFNEIMRKLDLMDRKLDEICATQAEIERYLKDAARRLVTASVDQPHQAGSPAQPGHRRMPSHWQAEKPQSDC